MDKPAEQPTPVKSDPRSNRLKVYIGCVVLGFVIGLALFGLPWMRAQRELNGVTERLQLSTIELHLASAAVMARHGDYPAARDAASRFFTEATTTLDAGGAGLTPEQQTYLQSVLAQRDELITLLARSDPAGAERATAMYVNYRSAFPR